MTKTYKMVTVVGTSPESSEEAIRNAVVDASSTLRNLGWFEVQEVRGRIEEGRVAEYQVKVQIGLRVES
jgi:flavin-binding protein dodecin